MNLENYRVKDSHGGLETHEVFLDTLAHKKEEELGISEKKFEVAIKAKIIFVIFGIFLVCAAVLVGRMFYFQIIEGRHLAALAQQNKGSVSLVRAERGIIYDKNMVKLVTNAPAYDLTCNKRNYSPDSASYTKEINTLSDILSKPSPDIQQEIISSDDPKILLAENIAQEQLLVLEAHMNDLPDCQIESNTARDYVLGSIFSQVLGYTAKVSKDELQSGQGYTSSDLTGKVGLENYYEQELRGTPGQVQVVKTATGIEKGDKVISDPVAGDNLVLNIDSGLQKATYDALQKSIKNIGAQKGAAIAMDPRTGAVLALVSYPSYDDNIFSQGISQADYSALINDPNQPFFNRAIAAKYPTGSAIKPFEASGVLQSNIIDPNKLINDPGYIIVHSQFDPSVTYRFAGVMPHGLVDMRKAIAVSSNIYFYTVGGGYGDQKGLGPSGIKKYLDMYGWEQKTGIDLPGEFSGFVPSPTWKLKAKGEPWWDGDTYNLSIGQSDLQVTPIQVVTAYAAIANGGTLYQPQIVNKIISSDGQNVIAQFTPKVNSRISIDSANLQIVREGMRDGVDKDYGSSISLNDLPVAVAGKTGTVQTNKPGIFNTWSCDFAPYENPTFVFCGTIEGVAGLRAATLPVAHDVLQYYFGKNTPTTSNP